MKYTVVVNGKPEGPYELGELKALGIIQPGTFLKREGMDDYKEAHEFEELRALFGFRFQPTAPQYFAGFDQRLLAAVIDYFFLTMGYIFLLLLSFIFVKGQAERMQFALFSLPFIPLAKLIYGSMTEASPLQATIGKRLLDIKVTDLQGLPLSAGKSWARNLAKILSVLPFFFGYLYSFLNKKHQCVHDVMAETLVVKKRLL